MTLRLRLVFALLLSSLASVALVGGVAYQRLNQKFDEFQRQEASERFREHVTDYFRQYGSWEAGQTVVPLRDYIRLRAGTGPNRAGPRPPDRAPQGEGPPDGDDLPPPQQGQGPAGRRPPPFRFVLLDSQYRVLLGAGDYPDGTPAPEEARRGAQPVVVDDTTVAYISPVGVMSPGRQDLRYLRAMREALMVGAAAAAVLALGLGLVVSRGMSQALHRLTLAAQAMQGGALRQQVAEAGSTEVKTLARAFNQMSAQLAHSHEALLQSNQTILRQADELKEMSMRDALTGLYNRRHFDEQARLLFEQARRYGQPLTVVMGDIDFFKRINDSFSHATGDVVLKQIGAILRSHMRVSDVVARYGGEEFVIVLPQTPLPMAAALCDKLRGMIESFPWSSVHPELRVTMSMGLCADRATGTVEAMLQQADAMLYRAKESGRNRICFA